MDITDPNTRSEQRIDPNTLRVTRRSSFTGVIHTYDLPINENEEHNWKSGMLIQNALPQCSNSQREFLLTGSTPEEWDAVFTNDEED